MCIFQLFYREKSLQNYGIKAFFAIVFLLLTLTACNQKTEIISSSKTSEGEQTSKILKTKELVKPTETWYAFQNGSVVQFQSLGDLDKSVFLPWTEVPYVSGIAMNLTPAVFLVNKYGFLSFDKQLKPSLKKFSIFQNFTAEDFFISNENLYFHSFRNSLFSPNTKITNKVFLYEYNPITENILAVFTTADLKLSDSAQCTYLQKHGQKYVASFKTENSTSVKFDFFQFDTFKDITNKTFKRISKGTFQSLAKHQNLNIKKSYNDDLKTLLQLLIEKYSLSKKANLVINVNSEAIGSKQTFIVNSTETTNEIQAQTNYNKTDECLYMLFSDGAFYAVKNTQRRTPIFFEFQLPKLPDNFEYTYFSVENTEMNTIFLIACWQEKKFFQIGKSGFVVMPAKGLEPLQSCL